MNSINRISTLVIIPAHNAANHLKALIKRLDIYVCRSNLLIINDGSTDNTMEVIKELGVNHLWFSKNRGKGAALKAGFNYALANNYRSVLTLDSDLQHPPEMIPEFFSYDNGLTLVIGTRKMTIRNTPLHRFASNSLTSIIISIFSKKRIRDSQSGFKLIPTNFLRNISLSSNRYDFESELLLKGGVMDIDMIEVEIPAIYYNADENRSHINPIGDVLRFIRQLWYRIWF